MPDMTETLEEKSCLARGRSQTYHLLAAFYLKEASLELLDILRTKEIDEFISALDVTSDTLLPIAPDGDPAFLDELACEYAALFVLPGGVSPYASVHLKGQLCHEPELEVRAFYADSGLVVQDNTGLMSDHIGIELDFMGFLAEMEADSLEAGDDADAHKWRSRQREFFTKHIKTWAFGLMDDLDRYAYHPFYKGAALITRNLLHIEKEELTSS